MSKFNEGDVVNVVKVDDHMLVNIDPSMRKYVGHPYMVSCVIEHQWVNTEYTGNYSDVRCDHYVLELVDWYPYPTHTSMRNVDMWVFTEDMLQMHDINL